VLFVELRSFERDRDRYLTDESLAALQLHLAKNPTSGVVIRGSSGLRKLRWPDSTRQRGKRGSLRVIYVIARQDHEIWLVSIYGKSDRDNLKDSEIRFLSELIDLYRR